MSYRTVLLGLGLLLFGAGLGGGCGRSSDVVGGSDGGSTGTGGEGERNVFNFEPCAQVSEQATLTEVNMYILIDRSGSMNNDNKWDNTEAAFVSFFQAEEAAALNVALRFWPDEGCDHPDPDNPSSMCDTSQCATPQVALGSLANTAHQQALINLFAAKDPGGWTPMSGALQGGADWARAQNLAQPDEKAIVVLVTDGEPRGCIEDPAAIAQIASDAFQDGIPVYAVGLEGSGEALMNAIASAGGTTTGFFIGSMNGEQELLAAMLDIAGSSVSCSFAIPPPFNPGDVLDPELVRIEYASQDGTTQFIGQVDNADACGAEGGWYYDNNTNPMVVTLCGSTCAEVQSDISAKIDLSLGCECETDADCPGDNICFQNKCIDPCVEDSDCPAEHICIQGRCVPQPGDPCTSDDQCPVGLFCIGGQCSPGGVIVGRHEAVQGGAFSCAASRSGDDDIGHWIASLFLAGALAMRRRRTA